MSKHPGLTDAFLANLMSYAFQTFTELTPGQGMRPAFFAAVRPALESAYTRGQNSMEWDRRAFQGTCPHPPEHRADAGGGLQACSRCGAVVAMEPPRSHDDRVATALGRNVPKKVLLGPKKRKKK